jgi:hypothetical protein
VIGPGVHIRGPVRRSVRAVDRVQRSGISAARCVSMGEPRAHGVPRHLAGAVAERDFSQRLLDLGAAKDIEPLPDEALTLHRRGGRRPGRLPPVPQAISRLPPAITQANIAVRVTLAYLLNESDRLARSVESLRGPVVPELHPQPRRMAWTIRVQGGSRMKKSKSKLNIKDLEKSTAIPLTGEQLRLVIGGAKCEGGTTSDTADTDQ